MPAGGTKARLTGGGALLAEGSRLHGEVSKAEATGRGDAVASIPNRLLGQGKRKIWAGAEPPAQDVSHGKGDGSSRGEEVVAEKDRGRIRPDQDQGDGSGSGRKGGKKDRDKSVKSKKSSERKGKEQDRDGSEEEEEEDQDRVERRLAKRARREARAEEKAKAARKAEKKAARKARREEEDGEAGEGDDGCSSSRGEKKEEKNSSKKRKHKMGEQGEQGRECSGEDDENDEAAEREKKERKAAKKARNRHAEVGRCSDSDGDDDGPKESKGEDKDSAMEGSGKKKRKKKTSKKKKKKKTSSTGAPSLPAPRLLPPLKLQPSALPAVEALRSSKVWKLHRQLEAWCYEAGGAMPPALTFERWLLNGLPRTRLAAAAGTVVKGPKGPKPDPLLHADEAAGAASVHLIADLTRASIPLLEAQSIAEKLTKASTLAAADVAKTLKQAVNGAPAKIELVRHRHTIDICIAGRDKRVLKLNHEHYDKLRAMWRLRKAGGAAAAAAAAAEVASESSGGGSAKRSWDEEFHASLFSMLQRYNSLQGHGFQAACPEQVS